MLLWLRSALFTLQMFVTVWFYATAVALLWWAPYPTRFAVARAWCKLQVDLVGAICGLRYRVEGREHLPADRPAICYLKHQSAWETLVQLVEFPPQCWVHKLELVWVPIFGWALRAMDAIAIDRGAGREAVQQVVEQGRRQLAAGKWVMIFPEGTRMPPGTTRRYGLSGALLAREAGVPIVPVAHNAGDYWRRNDLIKRPGTIVVRIGPPIEPRGRDPEAINAEAQAWIEAQMKDISPGYAGTVLERR
jgi:1-acyl-sn-glycerol-3-phosphate acyltransferase